MTENHENDSPQQFSVYLVPSEPEAKDDILRFAVTKSEANGVFTFKNLAFGKYFLYVEPFKIEKDETLDLNPPIFWNAEKRAKLREMAEKKNVKIELKPCETLTNQILNYSTQIK